MYSTAKILKATKNVAWHIRFDLTEAMKEGEDGQKSLEVAEDAMAPVQRRTMKMMIYVAFVQYRRLGVERAECYHSRQWV